ncbi:MAG TPA: Rap1a/Tai family immunity protein [Rhizomicrobium sp.]|nr:Rap1a/Tai family immunity protein [Rhizomicrobium sp.]
MGAAGRALVLAMAAAGLCGCQLPPRVHNPTVREFLAVCAQRGEDRRKRCDQFIRDAEAVNATLYGIDPDRPRNNFCTAGIQDETLRVSVAEWLSDRAGLWNQEAAEGTYAALMALYPCKPSPEP